MLLNIVTSAATLLLIVLIWVAQYAKRLSDTKRVLLGRIEGLDTERRRLEAHIKVMSKAHHFHLENIAKIYLAEVNRLRDNPAELLAGAVTLQARDSKGRFLRVAK